MIKLSSPSSSLIFDILSRLSSIYISDSIMDLWIVIGITSWLCFSTLFFLFLVFIFLTYYWPEPSKKSKSALPAFFLLKSSIAFICGFWCSLIFWRSFGSLVLANSGRRPFLFRLDSLTGVWLKLNEEWFAFRFFLTSSWLFPRFSWEFEAGVVRFYYQFLGGIASFGIMNWSITSLDWRLLFVI